MAKMLASWPWPLPARRSDCPCPKVKCGRRGACRECYAYHGRKGHLPRCVRKGAGR